MTAPPAATLQQTLPAATQAAVSKKLEEDLKRAKDGLNRVNYAALSPDAKSQYATAQRFVAEAEQARTEGNLALAAKVAEKAAGLAAGLPVR